MTACSPIIGRPRGLKSASNPDDGLSRFSMDRRYDMRVPTDLPVSVVQLEDGTKFVGTLVDISDSGICASLPESLAPGTLVQVRVLEVGLFGEIVYSNP